MYPADLIANDVGLDILLCLWLLIELLALRSPKTITNN
jgi:hypothetical protein